MEYKLVIGYIRIRFKSTKANELKTDSLNLVKDFEGKVNLMINEGWIPQGGIYYRDGVAYQAMVRHTKDVTDKNT